MSGSRFNASALRRFVRRIPRSLGVVAVLTGAGFPQSALNAAAPDTLDIAPSPSAVAVVEVGDPVRRQLPDTLFGFNIQHFNFQNDLWRGAESRADPGVVAALSIFKGGMYRYPGGLVANRFAWKLAVGPAASRPSQRAVKAAESGPVLFGPAEYLEFVREVGGMPFYVLNLVGWDQRAMHNELPAAEINANNAELAAFIRDRLAESGMPRYYQLGNELDRAEIQWPHEKYIERAKGTMEAIRAIDPEAHFVAFLRDFNWRYRNDPREGTVSSYQDFIRDVLQGLPGISDFSFQFYYDDPGLDQPLKLIPVRLKQFRRAIEIAREAGHLEEPRVWITEHARGINLGEGKSMQRAYLTSNLAAAISTGDFLIALAQIPEVQGAALHGLNAGPWQVFDATIEHRDLRPRPVYWGMRVLHAVDLPVVLRTRTASPNESGYAGGYDTRTVALTSEGADRIGLWAVNRAARPAELRLAVDAWKDRPVAVRHYYLSGQPGVDPDDPEIELTIELDPEPQTGQFSASGDLRLELPASSVSSFLITPPGAALPGTH
jgi:alpha-L-arabinofuranosidase